MPNIRVRLAMAAVDQDPDFRPPASQHSFKHTAPPPDDDDDDSLESHNVQIDRE